MPPASPGEDFHRDLHERALTRRWRPDEDRLQLSCELAILAAETQNYDTFLDRAAELIAIHLHGGCVIGLADEAGALHPLAVFHEHDEAREALGALTGKVFTPLQEIEDTVLDEGRGRRLEMLPEVFVERPGIARYIEITGHRSAVVVPLRVRSRSIGVLWTSAERELDDDDVNFLEIIGTRVALAVDLARFAEGDQTGKRPTEAGPASELTAREREILALVAEGMTSREVADHLVVSVRTVEWHRGRIQSKLGVAGRAALTQVAREAGLVPG